MTDFERVQEQLTREGRPFRVITQEPVTVRLDSVKLILELQEPVGAWTFRPDGSLKAVAR